MCLSFFFVSTESRDCIRRLQWKYWDNEMRVDIKIQSPSNIFLFVIYCKYIFMVYLFVGQLFEPNPIKNWLRLTSKIAPRGNLKNMWKHFLIQKLTIPMIKHQKQKQILNQAIKLNVRLEKGSDQLIHYLSIPLCTISWSQPIVHQYNENYFTPCCLYCTVLPCMYSVHKQNVPELYFK